MPTFTFTSPEGKQYTVNGPDGATQEQAWGILQNQLQAQPQQPAIKPDTNPASSGTETYFDIPSMSFKQRPASNFVAGMGEQFVNTGRGLKQLVQHAGNKLGLVSDDTVNQTDADIAEARRLDAPLNATAGGKTGQVAGGAATLAAAPEGLLGAIGGGAALSGAQPTAGNESRLANTAIGGATGAAGYGIGRAIGALAQPVVNRLSATYRDFVAVLTREGVPTDLAQATGSKAATTLKNAANDSPFVSTRDFQDQQASAFTQAALRNMGVNGANEATPVVMQAGKQRLKDTYNAIAARNSVALDAQYGQDISRVRYQAERSLTPDNAHVVQNQLDDIETMMQNNGGRLSGEGYQQVQSQLDKVARDGGKAPFVTDIRQALTSAMQRQASPGDAALLAQTNQRYAAMKAIEKAIGDDNQVSPARLFNALDTTKGANQTVYGQGANQRLVQLAQAGKAVIGKSTPNSGTAQRLLGAGAVGSGGAALYDLATGKQVDPGHLAEGAIAAGFAPAAARALAYSPAGREYLGRWANSQIAAGIRMGAGRVGGAIGGASVPSSASPPPPPPQQ